MKYGDYLSHRSRPPVIFKLTLLLRSKAPKVSYPTEQEHRGNVLYSRFLCTWSSAKKSPSVSILKSDSSSSASSSLPSTSSAVGGSSSPGRGSIYIVWRI